MKERQKEEEKKVESSYEVINNKPERKGDEATFVVRTDTIKGNPSEKTERHIVFDSSTFTDRHAPVTQDENRVPTVGV